MDNNTNLKRKAETELEGSVSKIAKTSHACETCGKVGVSEEIIEEVREEFYKSLHGMMVNFIQKEYTVAYTILCCHTKEYGLEVFKVPNSDITQEERQWFECVSKKSGVKPSDLTKEEIEAIEKANDYVDGMLGDDDYVGVGALTGKITHVYSWVNCDR